MGLLGAKWNSRNIIKAKAAIDELTDQSELERAAENARYAVVQWRAVGKLTDPNVLIRLARNARNSDVRCAAVSNAHLTDETVLSDIAKNDESIDVRGAAETRLEKMKKEQNIKMEELRIAEVQKMKDTKCLAVIARTDGSYPVRAAAIRNRNLTDQAVLADVAKYDDERSLQILAIKRITDDTLLASLQEIFCQKSNHFWVRDRDYAVNEGGDIELYTVYKCALCDEEENRLDRTIR